MALKVLDLDGEEVRGMEAWVPRSYSEGRVHDADRRYSCVLGMEGTTVSKEEDDMHLSVVREAVMDRRHTLLSLSV